MKFPTSISVIILGAIASVAGAQPRATQASAESLLAGAAPVFIENQGQFDPAVRFRARAGGATLWLTDEGMWLTLQEPSPRRGRNIPAGPLRHLNLKIRFDGAQQGHLEPFGRVSTQVSYLLGSDRNRWRSNVAAWSGVRYVNLYQGVDLEVGATAGKLSWRWVLSGASAIPPPASALQVEGGDGVTLEKEGVRLASDLGEVRILHPPAVGPSGTRVGSAVRPAAVPPPPIPPPNPTPFLPIFYSSFLGGASTDEIRGLAIDALNRLYVTGLTISSNFPTTPGVLKSTFSGGDAFVTKINTNGTVAYSTYLGGSGSEEGLAIAVDNHDFSVWVTGDTASTDFPIPVNPLGVIQKTNVGTGGNAFLAKINPTGTSLLFATYFGGGGDQGVAIQLDSGGLVYMAGNTTSNSFPTTANAFQKANPGFQNPFVAKIDPVNNIVIFSTYLGGSGNSLLSDMAIDSSGVYLTGFTESNSFPTSTGAIQPTRAGGDDVFIAKLSLTGTGLIYSTYLGTPTFGEHGHSIAVDSLGQAVVVGNTASPNFPVTAGVIGQSLVGSESAFITKINATGSGFVFSTLLGGTDSADRVALDSSGNVYVAGSTDSPNLPVTPDAFQSSFQGIEDTFLAVIKNNGTLLSYATYFGGSAVDSVAGLAVSSAGIFLAGTTSPTGSATTDSLPVFHANQGFAGLQDGFVVMFHLPGPAAVTGLVFNDANRNGIKDGVEGGVGNVFVSASGAESTLTFITTGTYSLGNLTWGSYLICVQPAAIFTVTTASCQTVLLSPGEVVSNVNFGIVPKQFSVGVGDLQPASATVSPGSHIDYAYTWTHPQNWHLLDQVHLRFVDEYYQTIFWVRFEEGSNTFAVYDASIGDFGPPLTPGSSGTVETPYANLYLSDSTFTGSGPTGPSVLLNYDLSFNAAAAGHTYQVLIMATDDDGVQEGFDPGGFLNVQSRGSLRRTPPF